jgi:hypothetical protein
MGCNHSRYKSQGDPHVSSWHCVNDDDNTGTHKRSKSHTRAFARHNVSGKAGHRGLTENHPRASAQHNVNDRVGHHGLPENHVRLMRILPGRRKKSVVRCETRVFSLPVDSGYTAISYAWGPPVADHAIVLDGRKHLVAKNLWHFLTTWRSFILQASTAEESSWKPCHSWLWIDALSIDQNNMQERNHQVKIMSKIFGGADEVLVWLGLANTKTNKASRHLLMSIEDAPKGYIDARLREVCERMYWTRLWVFQELKSAKQVSLMCGSDIVPFAALAKSLANLVPGSREHIDAQSRRLMRHSAAAKMVDLCGQHAPTSLWLLLQLTQHLNCYDPRDKVYALLSMAKSGADGIEADYTMTLPQLMNRVLSNLHSRSPPTSAGDVAIRCARLKAMMGLEPDFPWGADDYLAAERFTQMSTDPT